MRKINKIIIHCSATPKHKDFSAETIRDWHVKGNGWDDIGYHYVVRLDGSLEYGRPVQVPGAHCRGENKSSIGICYIGGMDEKMEEWEDTRTQEQKDSLVDLLKVLKKFHPEANIYGHRDFHLKLVQAMTQKQNIKNYERYIK